MSLVHIQNSQIKYRTKRCFSDFLIVKLKSFTFHIRPEIAFRPFRFFSLLYDFGFLGKNILFQLTTGFILINVCPLKIRFAYYEMVAGLGKIFVTILW